MLKFKRSTQTNASSHQLPINFIFGNTSITNIRLTELTAAWLAQLRERRSAELKLTPAGPTTTVFKKLARMDHPGCDLHLRCLIFTKSFRKIRLESKYNTTSRVVLEENFRKQRNV